MSKHKFILNIENSDDDDILPVIVSDIEALLDTYGVAGTIKHFVLEPPLNSSVQVEHCSEQSPIPHEEFANVVAHFGLPPRNPQGN